MLIATAKGESSGPNNLQGKLKGERKRKEHPYIPTLIGGSIQRLSLADIAKNLAAYTHQVGEDNLVHSDGGKFEFAGLESVRANAGQVLKLRPSRRFLHSISEITNGVTWLAPGTPVCARRGPRDCPRNLLGMHGFLEPRFLLLLFFFRPLRNFFIARPAVRGRADCAARTI